MFPPSESGGVVKSQSPAIREFRKAIVPLFQIAVPVCAAEFAATVVLMSLIVPSFTMPPPPASVAELPDTVLLASVKEPP